MSFMALRFAPIWVTPHSQIGEQILGSNRSVTFLALRVPEWQCCSLGVAAQKAITSVEDQKPQSPEIESPGKADRAQEAERRLTHFHKDLKWFPRPLSSTDLSCSDNSQLQVAYRGIPGAYSEIAALTVYPKCRTFAFDQFEDVFKAVESRFVDKAVLPIENSIAGSVHRNYDLLLRHNLYITGEVQLPINHCLLGLPGVRKDELKRVLSHPQALSHCEKALSKLGLARVSADDTAGAAQTVAGLGKRHLGAIASSRAAEIYGLDILAQRIQDDDVNVTRFLILERDPVLPTTDVLHKTSIVFSLVNGVGSLFTALAVFALRDISLSKIESRPQRMCPMFFDYIFYIDFEASMAERRAQDAMERLKEFSTSLRVLGSYPVKKDQ